MAQVAYVKVPNWNTCMLFVSSSRTDSYVPTPRLALLVVSCNVRMLSMSSNI